MACGGVVASALGREMDSHINRDRAGARRGPSTARGPSAIGAGKTWWRSRVCHRRDRGRLLVPRLEKRGARLELLDDHARGGEHGEAAVLELLGLHLLERLGVLGLEAERVEVEVARRVARAELEVVLRHRRLHPAAERTERLRHGDEEEDHGPEARRHLPELVDADAADLALEEGREARLADEEAERS